LPHAAIAASAEDVKQRARRSSKVVRTVSTITTKDDVEIFYKDWGRRLTVQQVNQALELGGRHEEDRSLG
jgi:hypothetical protein